jgi:MinD-like ATPase involved in chromosome partitioning or flagellar assembly
VLCVLLMASGAAWEQPAFGALTARPDVVVLKRCVDVDDLLAAATSGQADVAVVALEAPGLDVGAVGHLRRHGVRPVAVVPDPSDAAAAGRAGHLDVAAVVGEADVATLPDVVTAVEDTAPDVASAETPDEPEDGAPTDHRTIVVWGPAGAPGRTTVAVTLAAELARRERATVLVDGDPHGGSVAQQLGILDEVSGLLSAARLAGGGQLGERFPSVCRGVGDHLSVVTGLPRPDRWVEVRDSAFEQLLVTAAGRGHVVVDTGFGLEEDPGSEYGARPARHAMTLTALDLADEVVVVGSADPVGLSRLARGLVDLRERLAGAPVRVVVNRMRPTLGWSEKEIAGMVEGFARLSGLHFLPDDQPSVDRAIVSGRSLAESTDSPLAAALSDVVDAVVPESAGQGAVRRRRGGRARRR